MRTDLWIYFLVLGAIWTWLVVFTIRRTHADPRGSVGLPTAVLLIMSFLYGGAFVYAVPGYTHLRPFSHWYFQKLDFTEMMVLHGTIASLIGLFAFCVGCGAFVPKRRIFSRRTADVIATPLPPRRTIKRTVLILGLIGGLSFLGHYLRLSFPMSSALFETGRNMAAAFLCLAAYLAMRQGKPYLHWILIAALIPLYYLVIWGFTSYGFMFMMVIIAFWTSQLRAPHQGIRKIGSTATTLAFIWILLTLFVAWLSFRDEIRLVVWAGDEGSILGIMRTALQETELFSPWNFDSLDLINIRLNLPLFIGKMMEQHAQFPELRLWGATLYTLPLVILPRFLWPGKPERGGNDFMSDHTGIAFYGDTSFGTGSVFEFYVNFGYIGVFFGFLFLGWFVRYIDRNASICLNSGRYLKFIMLMTAGLFAIDPLLRPFFVFNGLVFALIILNAAKPFLQSWIYARK